MDLLGWNTVLYAGKWVFIGLIYFVLTVVLLAVRREFSARVEGQPAVSAAAPGRLRVTRTGSDTRLQPGMLLDLRAVTRLGKDSDNDVVLNDEYISRQHARLRWDGLDWWVEDLGSRTGTHVNGQAVSRGRPVQMPVGAHLRVGGMEFLLVE